jgi:platelet-activating factor acetylhydrolase IB subunit alpha
LNQAILDYLNSSGFEDSFEAFRKEANVDIDPKKNGLLEKKWASILRLQKKVIVTKSRTI